MKKLFKKLIVGVIILNIYQISLFAQETQITFQHITKNDGLSHGNIHNMFKDSRGFMWFCTENGLDRYDGYTLKHYRNDPQNSNTLSINFVTCISEDKEGILWIGTKYGGLNKYDPVRESFTRINLYTDSKTDFWQANHYNWVTAIIPCKKGGLWIGTRNGLFRLVPDTLKISWADTSDIYRSNGIKFIHYQFRESQPDGLHYNSIYCLCEDRAGNLWIGFDSGKSRDLRLATSETGALQKLIPGKNGDYPPKYEKYQFDSGKPQITKPRYLVSIYEDRNGYLWIGSWADGLFRFDPMSKNFISIKNLPKTRPGNTDIYQVIEDLQGNLWVASYGNGVFKIPFDQVNSDEPSFIQYIHSEEKEKSLSNNHARCFVIDSSGILWIGTLGDGINKLIPQYRFERYYNISGNPRSLAMNNVTAFYEDKRGILWVATNDYLNKYDSGKKIFSRFHLKSKEKILINSIYEDNYGRLLAGTNHGIYRFDIVNEQFSNFLTEIGAPDSLKSKEAKIYGGKNCYLAFKNEVYHLINNHIDSVRTDALKFRSESFITADSKQNLWIGIDYSGLFQYDSSYKLMNNISCTDIYNSMPYSNTFNNFYDIKILRDSVILCGTNEGLLRIYINNKKIDKLTEVDGLANNNVYGIVVDQNGFFWISTQNGLSRFNPVKKQFLNFYSGDGLQGNEFNPDVRLISSDGKIYFGGKEGITAFYPDSIKIRDYIPPVVITDFKIFNKTISVGESLEGQIILTKSIMDTRLIELSHDMNVISFEFAALDYDSPMENKYAYKMEGIDPEWVYVNADRRFANYSGLQPGEYTFHLKACNKYGTWNEKGFLLRIIILHPFWTTPWFRILVGIIILSFIILVFKIRMEKIRKRNLQLHEINTSLKMSREKYKALADYTFDWEFWRGVDDNYIYISPSVENITGYSVNDFYKDPKFIFSIIHPDDHKKWKDNYYKSNQIKPEHLEFRIITKDNQVKWISRTHRAIYDEDGKYQGIRGTNRDITESVKEREEILRLAAIIEQSVETIMILNTEKVIIFINDTFLKRFGYAKEDVLDKDLLKSNIFNFPKVEVINEILNKKSAWAGKTKRNTKDGKGVIESTIISPIFNKEGNVINYVIIGKDITHEEELEKRLIQSQKMEAIGTLAGGIAHDFNNILTSIMGNTQLLEKHIPQESIQKKYFERIVFAIRRASGLANQILSFSRPKEIEIENIRVGPIVNEALKLLRASLPSTIEIHSNIREDIGNILGDPIQIHQIVMNLVTNAKYAMGEKGGLLSVDLDEYILESSNKSMDLPPGKYVKLIISDTGHGIESSIIDRIFEPYFTTKEIGEGTGLGLAVVHGIVKNHNGYIFVESEAGKGTAFTILLPVVQTSLEEKKTEDEEMIGGNERILVVDDEESIVDVIDEMLNEFGYMVKKCINSPEALEMFKREPEKFDLIITDMTMPKMVGTDLSREVRKIRKDIPIIICTGYSEILDKKGIEHYEINGLIKKPIEINRLLKMVRNVLDGHKQNHKI